MANSADKSVSRNVC